MIKMVVNSLEISQTKKVEESEALEALEGLPKPLPVFHDIQDIRNLKGLDKLIADNPNTNMVLDFWAEYCGPCKAFAPIFKSLHKSYCEKFIFAKLDIEHDIRISHKYKITSIPTQIIIKNDSLVYKHVGSIDYNGLEEKLERFKDF